MDTDLARWGWRAGHLLLGLIFFLSGLGKFGDWSGTAGYMAAKGMVAIGILLPVAALVEIAGGLAVITGFGRRLGALALFLFLIPTTLVFHDFWNAAAADRQNQMIHFMKNLAIMGGLLIVASRSDPTDG